MTSNSSSISQESEESPTITVPTDANSDASREANPIVDSSANAASITASSEASADANPVSGVKDAVADLSTEAMKDSSNDVSIDPDPTDASFSDDANADTGSEFRAEEDNNVSIEATRDSVSIIQPTATTRANTDANTDANTNANTDANTDANTNAITDVEEERAEVSTEANPNANRPGPSWYARREDNMASPPRRQRPYRFGFLGPISHFYSNQPVARETLAVRHHPHGEQQQVSQLTGGKLTGISVATAGNLAKSSSEETDQ